MESGTPGNKGTSDGWLNRVMQTASREGRFAVPCRLDDAATAAFALWHGSVGRDVESCAIFR